MQQLSVLPRLKYLLIHSSQNHSRLLLSNAAHSASALCLHTGPLLTRKQTLTFMYIHIQRQTAVNSTNWSKIRKFTLAQIQPCGSMSLYLCMCIYVCVFVCCRRLALWKPKETPIITVKYAYWRTPIQTHKYIYARTT